MRCHCWSQSNSIWSSNEVVNRFLRLTCSYCPRIDFFFLETVFALYSIAVYSYGLLLCHNAYEPIYFFPIKLSNLPLQTSDTTSTQLCPSCCTSSPSLSLTHTHTHTLSLSLSHTHTHRHISCLSQPQTRFLFHIQTLLYLHGTHSSHGHISSSTQHPLQNATTNSQSRGTTLAGHPANTSLYQTIPRTS